LAGFFVYRLLGHHGGIVQMTIFWDFYTVWYNEFVPMLRRNMVPPSSRWLNLAQTGVHITQYRDTP